MHPSPAAVTFSYVLQCNNTYTVATPEDFEERDMAINIMFLGNSPSFYIAQC